MGRLLSAQILVREEMKVEGGVFGAVRPCERFFSKTRSKNGGPRARVIERSKGACDFFGGGRSMGAGDFSHPGPALLQSLLQSLLHSLLHLLLQSPLQSLPQLLLQSSALRPPEKSLAALARRWTEPAKSFLQKKRAFYSRKNFARRWTGKPEKSHAIGLGPL